MNEINDRKKSDIRRLRCTLLLTAMEFAELLGVAPGTVNTWEKGKKLPGLTQLRQMRDIAKENKIPFDPMQYVTF